MAISYRPQAMHMTRHIWERTEVWPTPSSEDLSYVVVQCDISVQSVTVAATGFGTTCVRVIDLLVSAAVHVGEDSKAFERRSGEPTECGEE